MALRKGEKIVPQGLARLLSGDPGQLLLHALEAAEPKARALSTVNKHIRPRREQVGWVHVSDMLDPCCNRAIAARILGYNLPGEEISPRLQRIFDTGTYMHLRWYSYFLALPKIWKPRVAIMLRNWPLVGEADAGIDHPEFGQFLVELKSINTNGFSSLGKGARADHVSQLNTYIGLEGVEAGGVVLYEDKNDQDASTHLIKYNRRGYMPLFERASAVADAVLWGKLPRACDGDCPNDDYVGNLHITDERLEAAAKEREKWLKKSQS